MKILFLSDSPTINTGFGHIARNIIRELLKDGHEITNIGINEEGKWHETRTWENLKITNALQYRDMFGRDTALQILAEQEFDHLFIIHDLETVLMPAFRGYSFAKLFQEYKQKYKNKVSSTLYFPIDYHIQSDQEYLKRYKELETFDNLIPYTQFAQEQILNVGVFTKNPIYHGLYAPEWNNVSRQRRKEVRKAIMGKDKTKTHKLILINGRNQWRKDIPTGIEAFAKIQKQNHNVFLYLNTQLQDQGGDLNRYLNMWGLKEGEDFQVRSAISERYGVSQSNINELYRVSDIVLNPAMGEGFGFSYLEAQWCGIPVFGGDVSVESELLPPEYLIPSNGEVYVPGGFDSTPYKRKTVLADDIVSTIITWFNKDQKEQQKIIQERQEFVKKEMNMEIIGNKFRKIVNMNPPK